MNALALLAGACIAGEENGEAAASRIFDIFDFDARGQISRDELTILLLCSLTSSKCHPRPPGRARRRRHGNHQRRGLRPGHPAAGQPRRDFEEGVLELGRSRFERHRHGGAVRRGLLLRHHARH